MCTPNIRRHLIMLRLGLALTFGLALLLGLLLTMGAAHTSGMALAQGSAIRYVAPVPTGNDSGNDCTASSAPCATVQRAVDEAGPGDEIRVATGIYTDVQARSGITQVVFISKTVTVRGGYTTTDWSTSNPISYPTTLDAQEQGRVLYVTGDPSIGSGQAISPTVEGLRIIGGNASGLGGGPSGVDAGGGVLVISATVIISNNQVLSNTALNGGGLSFYSSAYAALTGNIINNNKGWSKAGGLYFYNSPTATLTANTISNNTANHAGSGQKHFGGALFDHSNNAMLIGNTISGNRTANSCGGVCFNASDGVTLIGNAIISNTRLSGWDGFGAGVYLNNSKNASLVGNTISENTGQRIDHLGTILGGGLHIGNNSTATLISNTISSNGATRGGGLNIANSTVTLVSDIITGNTVYDSHGVWNYHPGGGGLYLNNSTVTLTNVVIADNQTETDGSGLYIEGSSPRLLHTTIARNTGGDGSGVYITGTTSTAAMTNTILVSHTVGITCAAGNTATLNGVLWYSNTVNTGGTCAITITNEYTGDPAFAADGYHLTVGSTAIDRGVNAKVDDDIDGESRPAGMGYDIGADEYYYRLYAPLILKNAPVNWWAENKSYCTTCAEEDNVNIPIFAPGITHFQVKATHPTYDIGEDNCDPDFSGCDWGIAIAQTTDTCQTLWDDGVNVLKVCSELDWWRPYTMSVRVDGQTASGHRLVWNRNIVDAASWPEFLVLYQDGNMRLKPHPPAGRSDVCFGSSVIIGPAPPDTRPYVDIQEISVSPATMSLDITYRDGGSAHLALSVDRVQAVADVWTNYDTGQPFATFRSMYVADGNADVDYIETPAGDLPILSGVLTECTTAWNTLGGPEWFFHRTVRSEHNTSAPDIRIKVLH